MATAGSAQDSGSTSPDRAMKSTIKRIKPPVMKPTGSTRVRCSMRFAPIVGVISMPRACKDRTSPTAMSEPPDNSIT